MVAVYFFFAAAGGVVAASVFRDRSTRESAIAIMRSSEPPAPAETMYWPFTSSAGTPSPR